jgi:hypothetical protein
LGVWHGFGVITVLLGLIRYFLRTGMPGVARRLVTFFASPKKVTQKRRPHSRCPSGSRQSDAPSGKRNQLASLAGRISACKRIPLRRRGACTAKPLLHLKHVSFLIRLTHHFVGSVSSGTSKNQPKKQVVLSLHFVSARVSGFAFLILFCC